jgi:hypothetical protein
MGKQTDLNYSVSIFTSAINGLGEQSEIERNAFLKYV